MSKTTDCMDFKSENFMVQSDDDEWITRCVVGMKEEQQMVRYH